MLKKLLTALIAGAVAKVVLDKVTGAKDHDADLWAEATDDVQPAS
jgi:hypothetical protein